MKQTIVGGLVGGIILFLWGMLAWTVLPLHEPSIREIPNEDVMLGMFKENLSAPGVYLFPATPKQDQQAEMELWSQKYQAGPIGMIVYDPRGGNPIMSGQMAVGLLLNFIAAFLASWFLVRSTAMTSTFVARVSFYGMIGVLISFASHLQGWNWMSYPMDYTTAMVADTIIGWLLAGMGTAAVFRKPIAAASATA